MHIEFDIPRPIADALQAVADRGSITVIDVIVEAVRSSDVMQHALRQAYPAGLTTFLRSEANH